MIELRDISKRYGKMTILKGVSCSFDQPGIYAILGPNGSGKTTILKIILGMVIPDKGDVLFDQKRSNGRWDYRSQIGYLPQIARFPDNLTVHELIMMIKDIRGEQSRECSLVEAFGLQPYLKKKLGNLSGGTRQKVNIVLTFMFDSPVYILDEPTAGLDPVSMLRLKELVTLEKEAGKIILITTHILSLVESLADEIVFLLEGHIHFNGTLHQLRDQTDSPDLEHSIAAILQ